MIKIQNLTKQFGKKTVLDNISFTVEEGEIVGFLGQNGAGKTTTMNILTGYLSGTSGSAEVNGINILDNPLEAKKLIGFLPEQPPLYLDMTVKEYLHFIYDLKGCTLDREKHLDEICEVIRIKHVYNRIIRNLSKGYRQRVGIAQALVGNPKVLIFDEPTVGLDPKQIIEIRNLIRSLGRNHTVILSTHILPEAQAVCDRMVIINEGQIVANEKTENIANIVDANRRLSVKICGPEKEVLSMLRGTDGIAYVETAGTFDKDSTTYLIESKPGIDMRKPLFYALAAKGWPIIGMESLGANLEDIFIAIVDKPRQTKPSKVQNRTKDQHAKETNFHAGNL
ncbi:MAG: ATP-binding cassette domain-containing protein [Clostridiales bacterium]|nr:ATP-binding cassette domain-containing protein [Clostridiales bacterium]